MGPNGSRSKLTYHVDMIYTRWIGSRFTFVYKGVFVIMQGSTIDSEQGLWICLID